MRHSIISLGIASALTVGGAVLALALPASADSGNSTGPAGTTQGTTGDRGDPNFTPSPGAAVPSTVAAVPALPPPNLVTGGRR